MRPNIALTCQRHPAGALWKLEPAFAIISYYIDAVWAAGGLPVPVYPPGAPSEAAAEVLDHVDGVIAIGGLDVDPARYGEQPHETVITAPGPQEEFEAELIVGALQREMPLFAICRGMQLLNVVAGGDMHQHVAPDGVQPLHGIPNGGGGNLHEVQLVEGSGIQRLLNSPTIVARCHHHQQVRTIAPGYRLAAVAADGCVEAIEREEDAHLGGFLLAVQWHPEETALTDPQNGALFSGLVEAARAYRESTGRRISR
jgi:putative glutamine amidotransferase